MIPVNLFMIQGGFWCFENGDCVQMFLEEMAVRHKKFSLFETGECGDWCIGICRYWIFDSVRSVPVFIVGRI